jgi:hypothetical protein
VGATSRRSCSRRLRGIDNAEIIAPSTPVALQWFGSSRRCSASAAALTLLARSGNDLVEVSWEAAMGAAAPAGTFRGPTP